MKHAVDSCLLPTFKERLLSIRDVEDDVVDLLKTTARYEMNGYK